MPAITERQQDWLLQLQAVIDETRHMPFHWGFSDCGTFVGDCVEVMTGHDPMAPYRGTYDNPLTFARALKSVAGGDLVRFWREALNVEVLTLPAVPRLGDIVVLTTPSGDDVSGIYAGQHVLARTSAGLASLPVTSIKAAFRV